MTEWWSHDHKPETPSAQQPGPEDRILWCLLKGEQRAEAVVRVIDGTGIDLRYLHNGELRASQLYRDDAQLQASAAAKRNDLLARGWVDPASLAWRADMAGAATGAALMKYAGEGCYCRGSER